MNKPLDLVPGLWAFQIVTIIVPTVAVALRFWSRALLPGKQDGPVGARAVRFWWDDWFALMSLPLSWVSTALSMHMASNGLGRPSDEVTAAEYEEIFRTVFVLFLFYDTAVALPKTSALFFYTRLFGSTGRAFRYATWLGHFFVATWVVVIFIVTVFMCNPPQKFWLPDTAGTCLPVGIPWLSSAIPTTLIDLYVIILPLPMLWKLQLKPSRKFLVTCVFLCGYCAIFLSLSRLLIFLIDPTMLQIDITYNAIPAFYLLIAEAPVSILSICLPNIFQLVRRGIEHGPFALFTSRTLNSSSRPSVQEGEPAIERKAIRQPSVDPAEQLLYGGGTDTLYTATAEEGSETSEAMPYPDAIRVRSVVSVSDQAREEKGWNMF